MSEPSVEYLRARLRYDPDTGKLYWKRHPDMRKQWNGRYAGTEAFTALQGDGYKNGSIDGQNYLAHRVAWAIYNGEWPSDQIDHENHDRTDNRICNIRVAGQYKNQQNTSMRVDNSSSATGVHWSNTRGKWRARIQVNGRDVDLGFFESFNAAVQRRKAAAFLYGFHENHGS